MKGKVAVGVNISAGVCYIAVARSGILDMEDEFVRLVSAAHLDTGSRLADLRDRFAQELRRLDPDVVAIVQPRQGKFPMKFGAAWLRVSMETSLLLAANDLGIAYLPLSQDAIAKGIEASDIPSRMEELVGARTKYWSNRALAMAAAVASSTVDGDPK
jgi:hypothetical protein